MSYMFILILNLFEIKYSFINGFVSVCYLIVNFFHLHYSNTEYLLFPSKSCRPHETRCENMHHVQPSDLPPVMDCCKSASSPTYSGCDMPHQKQMVGTQKPQNMESNLRVCQSGTECGTVTHLSLSLET